MKLQPKIAGSLMLPLVIAIHMPAFAASTTELSRVKGSVGYSLDAASPVQPIVTTLVIRDDAIAVTKAASAGIITMPDSSEIALGEKTAVMVGAFKAGTAGPGSTIAIKNGALRFSIKHPAAGKSNYVFTTTTSQVAIRGTDGYIASSDDEDTVSVTKASSANDVSVVAGGKTYHVAAGKTLHIKKRHTRVLSTSYTAGATHPAFAQFAGIHKPSVAGKPGAVAAQSGASTAKKKHHH